MTISFYLTRPQSTTDTSIFARICYNGMQLKYYTTESINPVYWNKEKQRAKQTEKFREFPEFNIRLKNIETDIKNTFRKWVNDNNGILPSPATLKIELDNVLKNIERPKERTLTFLGFFTDLIERTANNQRKQLNGKSYSKATLQVYRNTLNRIIKFAESYRRSIDFDTLDITFYDDFTAYLSKDLNLAVNTIGKDIKTIKTILNEATDRGINKNTHFRNRKFSVTTENTDSIYLTEIELLEFEALDLSDDLKLDSVRDLFLIGCFTGLRYSDFSILRIQDFFEDIITITQTKTGNKISIPVHPTVKRIVEKYNGNLPVSISNQKTNEYLKIIAKKIHSLSYTIPISITKGGKRITKEYNKSDLVCTHTARRSFATNEYINGTPTITIMAITGHRTEKAFLRYIKLTPVEHAMILKQFWTDRNLLKAV